MLENISQLKLHEASENLIFKKNVQIKKIEEKIYSTTIYSYYDHQYGLLSIAKGLYRKDGEIKTTREHASTRHSDQSARHPAFRSSAFWTIVRFPRKRMLRDGRTS